MYVVIRNADEWKLQRNYFVFEATADEINVTTEPSFSENVSQSRRN